MERTIFGHAQALIIWLLLSTGSIALMYSEGLPLATAFVLLAPLILVAFPVLVSRWWMPTGGGGLLVLGVFLAGADPLWRSVACALTVAVTTYLSRKTALTLSRRGMADGAGGSGAGISAPEVGVYAVLETELARGRRHEREFAVLSMERSDGRQPFVGGLPQKLRQNLYRYASVHTLADRVLAVVPEVSQRDMEGLKSRLLAANLVDGGLCIGSAVFPHDGVTADGLINAADEARRRACPPAAGVPRSSPGEAPKPAASKTA